MSRDWTTDRRSVLKIGLAVAALGAIGGPAIANGSLRFALTDPVVEPSAAVQETMPEPVRYLFTTSSFQRPLQQFTRLEAVWGYTNYMKIASCTVEYAGEGTHELTLEEDAVVQVAEDLGLAVGDRGAVYRTILEACTRIHPSILQTRLGELGVPIVTAAVTLAPHAPQAPVFRRWLGIEPEEETPEVVTPEA